MEVTINGVQYKITRGEHGLEVQATLPNRKVISFATDFFGNAPRFQVVFDDPQNEDSDTVAVRYSRMGRPVEVATADNVLAVSIYDDTEWHDERDGNEGEQ